MKQTGVEFLIEEVECRGLITKELRLEFDIAKKMEDDFVIGFGEYLDSYLQTTLKTKSVKELLEIYKKEIELL